ncbi:MAG: hypothetical protein KDJ75_09780 [Alphaproteobacteria bacterium]|nr:hypothetical protein [Alphaproteobacteria bacterium]
MVTKRKKYILSGEEKQEYNGLVSDAFNAANSFTGSEETYEVLMRDLILMEEFVRARNNDIPDEKLEVDFGKQSGRLKNEFNTISDILGHAYNVVYGMLSRISGLKDLLNTLSIGGARIDYSENVYVLTDRGFPSGGDGGRLDENITEFRKQPRLAILIKELNTIGVYTDDMIIRVGKVFENKVRKLPYVIVEIPRLGGKQVAICDQYGEISFVSQEPLHTNVWASHTKNELRALECVQDVAFEAKWPLRICNLLAYGQDRITPVPANRPSVLGSKIDLYEYEQGRVKNTTPLTEEMILQHMIFHFIAHGGKWPQQISGRVETLAGEKWQNWDAALQKGGRGVKTGQSLYKLAKQFVIDEAQKHKTQHGSLPDRNSGALEEYPEITWEMLEDSFLNLTGVARASLNEIFTANELKEKEDITLEDFALREIIQYFRKKGYKRWPNRSLKVPTSDKSEIRWDNLDLRLKRTNKGTGRPDSVSTVIRAFVVDQAKKYNEHHGHFPDKDSGALPDYPDITFEMIDKAYQAQKGLGKKTLERILIEESLIEGETLLSESFIFEHCLRYLKKHKSWPGAESGSIDDIHGENWKRWDGLLIRGQRGLQGDSSIAKLIHSKIAEQAQKFKDTTGTPPNRQSGPLPDYPNTTFEQVGEGFQNIESVGKTSLRRVLIEQGVLEGPAISLALIDTHIMHHLKNHRKWPQTTSGPVEGIEDEHWNIWGEWLSRGGNTQEKTTLRRRIDALVVEQAQKHQIQTGTLPLNGHEVFPDYPDVAFDMADTAYRTLGSFKSSVKNVLARAGLINASTEQTYSPYL